MARIRQDTLIGMSFSNIVAIFIVFAAAATLNAHGVTTIETAAQAAEALRPVAGGFAFLLFAFGIVGTGLLAVPVLAGSAAYAVSETLGTSGQPRLQAEQGQAFLRHDRGDHAGRGAAPICGNQPGARALLERRNQRHPGRPLMALMMLIVTNPRAMGHLTLSRRGAVLGWAATGVMTTASVLFFGSLF